MSLAGTSAITELWAKCKLWFGRSISSSTTATTVSVQLKNNAGDNLGSAASISSATTTAAGVMSADDKTKLNGIAEGANNYTHPTYTSKTSGLYKVTVDGTGHVSAATAVAKSDITALGIPGTDTDTHYTAVPKVGASTGTGNAAQADPYLKIIENSSVSGYIQLKAGDNVSVSSDSSGVVTFDTTYSDATTSTSGLMSSSDKTKLNGISSGAEVNQNAFSNIAVGDSTIAADGKTDTFELKAGANITLTPDTTNDKITIAATDTTYSDATTSVHGLMSTSDKTKLNGIAEGAEVNVQSDWNQTTDTADDYIKNKPTLGSAASKTAGSAAGNVPLVGTSLGTTANKIVVTNSSGALAPSSYTIGAASAKGVDTSISSGSTSANLPTTAAVVNYVAGQVSGATAFQGIANSNTDISGASAWVAGYYWVVGTAGTYVGQTCEIGDMVFCIETESTYSASNFSVVQNNIVEMTTAEIDAICV